MTTTPDYEPVHVFAHVVEDTTKGNNRPVEYRASHGTIVLNSANAYQQLCGVDPNRQCVYVDAPDSAFVICNDIGQASAPENQVALLPNPRGRVISQGQVGTEIYGQNEIWVAAPVAQPVRVTYSIVRVI